MSVGFSRMDIYKFEVSHMREKWWAECNSRRSLTHKVSGFHIKSDPPPQEHIYIMLYSTTPRKNKSDLNLTINPGRKVCWRSRGGATTHIFPLECFALSGGGGLLNQKRPPSSGSLFPPSFPTPSHTCRKEAQGMGGLARG